MTAAHIQLEESLMKKVFLLLIILAFIVLMLINPTQSSSQPAVANPVVGLPIISKAVSTTGEPTPITSEDLPPIPCMGGMLMIALIPILLLTRSRDRS